MLPVHDRMKPLTPIKWLLEFKEAVVEIIVQIKKNISKEYFVQSPQNWRFSEVDFNLYSFLKEYAEADNHVS